MKCRVCNRPISGKESMMLGLGPRCREHRTAIDQPELFGVTEGLALKPKKEVEVIDFDAITGRKGGAGI
jgi:hypothetical protein